MWNISQRIAHDFGFATICRRSEAQWLMSCVSRKVREFITGLQFRENRSRIIGKKTLTERFSSRKKTLQSETGEVQGKTCVLRKRDGIENRLIERRGNSIEIYECGRAYMSKLHRDEWLFNDANVSCFTSNHKTARFGWNKSFPFLWSSLPFKVSRNAIPPKGGTNSDASLMIGWK